MPYWQPPQETYPLDRARVLRGTLHTNQIKGEAMTDPKTYHPDCVSDGFIWEGENGGDIL